MTVLAIPQAVCAQSLIDSVHVHGFGGWAYGETDGHDYTLGSGDGQYDNALFAINFTAQPSERVTIIAQLRGEAVAGEDEFEVDYAFAAFDLSDAVSARIGRVKHPFGIYGEIYDVGTLRPFYLLAQGIYGPNGYTARAYNGIGITGWLEPGSDWLITYDVYAGQIEGDFEANGLLTRVPELMFEPNINFGFEVTKTIGFRVKIEPPVPGLSVGLSAYYGDDETKLEVFAPDTREVVLVSLEYLNERWTIRSEYGILNRGTDFELESGYLEAAYKLSDAWQVAFRYDDFEVVFPDFDLSQAPPFFEQMMRHEEIALGVNYWFGSNLVIRLSYHMVKGNRLAYLGTAEEVEQLLMTGELTEDTDMVLFGAQFSF